MLSFSKREEYGILFITSLAQSYGTSPIPLSSVSRKSNIKLPFLRQIAMDLRHAGLLTAAEGRKGGYRLAKAPSEISLGDVIQALVKNKLITCCDPKNPNSCTCHNKTEVLWRKLNRHYIKNYYYLTFDKLC